jgi:hypothetical protein
MSVRRYGPMCLASSKPAARAASRLRLRNVRALGVVLEIPVRADREEIPRRTGDADKDQVLGLADGLRIDILHLALAVEIPLPSRQRLEHLDVEHPGAGDCLADRLEWRPEDEGVLLPREVVPQTIETRAIGLLGPPALRDAIR